MKNNQLTSINEGSTHENNKYGGVPVGGNNTVEQGETINNNGKNKYVYSNRLFINETLTKDNNLPSYIKGKSFSKASEEINKKFKDRNDKHSLETKKVFLERLKEAQEALKQQEQQRAEQIAQSMQSNQQEVPDMMNGEVPQGMEEFVNQNQMFLGGETNTGMGEAFGGLATTGLDTLVPGLGSAMTMTDGIAKSIAGDSETGQQIAGMISGLGTIKGIGDAISTGNLNDIPGIGLMGFGKSSREKAKLNFLEKKAVQYNKGVSTGEFAYGGKLEGGGYYDTNLPYFSLNKINQGPLQKSFPKPPLADDLIKPTTLEEIQAYQLKNNIAKQGDKGFGTFGPKTTAQFELDKKNWTPETPDITMLKPQEQPFVEPTGVRQSMEDYYNANKNKDTEKKPTNFKNIANQALRLSPVLSNFSQLKGLKRPNPVGYTPLRNTYQYDPVDEVRQEKLISEEGNKQLSAINQSGASQGAMRNAITSVGLNTTKARSNAASEAEAQNRAQRLAFQQSQLGVNQYNNQLQNKAIDETRMDQGNYDTQKSKFIGQIGSDLGEIGKEQVYRDKAGQLFGYDENGKYLVGPKGEKIRVSENTQTTTTGYTPKKFGGYITRKKY